MSGPGLAGAAAGAPGLPLIPEREFGRFRDLLHGEAGIWLAPAKRALLTGRLSRRLRELGIASFEEYYARVVADPAERIHFLDRVTTHETHFFREPRHFAFLEEQVFPRWRAEAEAGRRPRSILAWSAGCSTGEEPYSLAMSLLATFPPGSGWEVEVLGTDISTRVLAQAREAVWPIAKAEEIPEPRRRAFMLRGTGAKEGLMKVGPEIRARVRFLRLNLNEASYPALGTFDLVFCRNVFIYFEATAKQRAVDRILAHLAERGYLFLGHAETLDAAAHRVRAVRPTVYTRHRPGLAAEP